MGAMRRFSAHIQLQIGKVIYCWYFNKSNLSYSPLPVHTRSIDHIIAYNLCQIPYIPDLCTQTNHVYPAGLIAMAIRAISLLQRISLDMAAGPYKCTPCVVPMHVCMCTFLVCLASSLCCAIYTVSVFS